MIAQERLYLTADRKTVVRDGDKRMAFLLFGRGQEIPRVLAEQYGIEDGRLRTKLGKKPFNKMAAAPDNKGARDNEEEPSDGRR